MSSVNPKPFVDHLNIIERTHVDHFNISKHYQDIDNLTWMSSVTRWH
jgi:hypothetical protein